MLEEALQSGSTWVLIWTALALGSIHTILGPDHYVPFAMLAKAEGWNRARTLLVTGIAGLGHVLGSVVIAGVLVALGIAAESWEGTTWGIAHAIRGDVAAWLLMIAGAAYAVWGTWRATRRHGQGHGHTHGVGGHPHKVLRVTPWVLFIIFVFGPCESLIPLMIASWGVGGLAPTILTALAFTLSTVGTIILAVVLLLAGINLVPLGRLERWTHALAGISLVACGGAIMFLGL